MVESNEMILVPGVGGRESKEVSRSVLAAIVEPRAEEIFSLVARELKKANIAESLASGVVLTGGASQLEGIPELAEQIFNLPAKLAGPQCTVEGRDEIIGPDCAVAIGLVRYGILSEQSLTGKHGKKRGPKFVERIKSIFSEYF
jgi:cell division protein FtsA